MTIKVQDKETKEFGKAINISDWVGCVKYKVIFKTVILELTEEEFKTRLVIIES